MVLVIYKDFRIEIEQGSDNMEYTIWGPEKQTVVKSYLKKQI